jgi:hypothetical protein
MSGRTLWLWNGVTLGVDSLSPRTAETVGEGARLGQKDLHLPSGDAANSLEDRTRRDFIKTAIAIMLVTLFVWFIFLVLMLP